MSFDQSPEGVLEGVPLRPVLVPPCVLHPDWDSVQFGVEHGGILGEPPEEKGVVQELTGD